MDSEEQESILIIQTAFDYSKLAPSQDTVPASVVSQATTPPAESFASQTTPPSAVSFASEATPPPAVSFASQTTPPPAVSFASEATPPPAVPFASQATPPPAVPFASQATPPPPAVPFASQAIPPPPAVPFASQATPPPAAVSFAGQATPPPAVSFAGQATPPPAAVSFASQATPPSAVQMSDYHIPSPFEVPSFSDSSSSPVQIPSFSAPNSPSLTESTRTAAQPTILQDLISLERIIGTAERDKFKKRFENGYDLTHDSLYNKWSEMYQQVESKKSGQCPSNGACNCSCEGIGYCECIVANGISPTPQEIQCPSKQHQYTISTPSGDVEIDEDLCGIMLMPKKSATSNSKKARRSLDPGNKCLTSEVFLKALKSENERKEKELIEKEEKKRERQRKAEEKRRIAQEKKELRLKKKMEKEQKKMEKEEKNKNKKTRKASRKETRKAPRKETRKCTDLPVLDALDENVDYTCPACEDEGFPSHNDA